MYDPTYQLWFIQIPKAKIPLKLTLISLTFTLNGSNIWRFYAPIWSSKDTFLTIDVAKVDFLTCFQKIMQKDSLFHKSNSFTEFTTPYLGKRLEFVFDLCIELKILGNKTQEGSFSYSFPPVFSFVKLYSKLVLYILDIR